ncbi:TetR/AcrR family transcriptional regulator [Bacteroides sp.]|uniref:TetR/AcrR family transcriptional regulator n=1 Tax=Bacteroides sp. TaxID=29523 RepID=UPI0026157BBF|nr:TetR/AcrR family transcriptional regulator [Bacteroides sp.]MDD3040670.1 TetR/AcrR family transcriptional regulator [Bacteroides sp.]
MEPPQKLSAEKRKNITIETVIELAGQQNPSEITTAAIAKHMGVTQGALFRHYATKDDLWQAVMEWVSIRLLDRLEGAARGASSPIESMKAMFLSHIEFVADHPGVPRMMFGELQRSAPTPAKRMAQTLIKNYRERLCTVIEEGKKSGEISPSLDAEAAAVLFIGMVQGLVMQSLISGDMGSMRVAGPSLFAIYQRGVAVKA